jgi:tRNA pseudouridine38-40 synthase
VDAQAGWPNLYVCAQVAYDGTDFYGFQVQRQAPTVQGVLEEALLAVTRRPVRVHGAGRTDAGVHARGQVIAAHAPWRHSIADLQRAWNAHLPKTVAIRHLQLAPDGFHPRFSALERTYRYTVVEADLADDPSAPRYSPLTDRFALYVTRRLDLAAMNEAARFLVGEHDFAAFGARPKAGKNTVRRVFWAEWHRSETGLPMLSAHPGRSIVFTIRADAFLHQMVRNLVGVLLEVGVGRRPPAAIQTALALRDRSLSAPPVPAAGLVLEQVRYPAGLNLQFD